MKPFFITALPRSRTSWFGAMMTTDSTLCFHEPIQTPQQLVDANPDFTVGVTDSTLALTFKDLVVQFPDSPWLYVERSPEWCQRSLIEFASPTVTLPEQDVAVVFQHLITASAAVKAHPKTLVVPFEEVDARMEEIWKHLLPDAPFCPQRAEILKRLDVQQQFAKRFAERINHMKGKE